MNELLILAGKLSDAARNVAGGNSITIGTVPPAHVYNLQPAVYELRKAVDAYDKAVTLSSGEAND